MPDFSIERANRAASGIRPVVTIPGREPAPHRRVKLYARAPDEIFATIAKLHDARPAAPPSPAGGHGFVFSRDLFTHPPRIGMLPVQLRRPVIVPRLRTAAEPLAPQHLMTAAVLGQFMVENAAGRTALARVLVSFVKDKGARHGMDALLLTALLHLEAVHDPTFQDALATWRASAGTAGSVEDGDSGVIVTPGTDGGLTSVPSTLFRDPFAGGVCLPEVVQHYQQLHGRDVMISSAVVVVIYGLVGGIRGALDAYGQGGNAADVAKGFVGGAVDGIVAGLKEVGGWLGKLVGWLTQDEDKKGKDKGKNFDQDDPGGSLDVDNPVEPDDPGGPEDPGGPGPDDPVGPDDHGPGPGDPTPTDPGPGPDPSEGGHDTDPGHDNDPDHEVPPPDDHGFPAPDDDGGSPWSLVATGALLAVSSARAMIQANAAPVFATSRLPGVAMLQQAFEGQQSLLVQAGSLSAASAALDPARVASFRTLSQQVTTEIAADAHIGAVAGGGPAGRVGGQASFVQR